jgi:hypothetical protein
MQVRASGAAIDMSGHTIIQVSRPIAVATRARSAPPDAPRLYYDESGRLLEATESIHPGDRFAHTMNLKRGAP